MKAVHSSILEILASCDDCGWECEANNAQGLASQHAERNGHLVTVNVTRHYEYATRARWSTPPSVLPPHTGSVRSTGGPE